MNIVAQNDDFDINEPMAPSVVRSFDPAIDDLISNAVFRFDVLFSVWNSTIKR